ncbi:MAG: zinc finger domain-containing protein, partial [Gammaproteobacteria bacterium]
AIRKGGTTLRNYSREDGSPGYFRVKLAVYDRAGEPCNNCGTIIKSRVHGQRASYYCMSCQQ